MYGIRELCSSQGCIMYGIRVTSPLYLIHLYMLAACHVGWFGRPPLQAATYRASI